jgi:flagellar protein FlbD
MIQLTRLNNQPLIVNSDLIKFIEEAPDTFVTLVSGEKIVVREKIREVVDRIVEFRRTVLSDLPIAWDASSAHHSLAAKPSTTAGHGPQK